MAVSGEKLFIAWNEKGFREKCKRSKEKQSKTIGIHRQNRNPNTGR